jgi:hypothetical protein
MDLDEHMQRHCLLRARNLDKNQDISSSNDNTTVAMILAATVTGSWACLFKRSPFTTLVNLQ